MATYILPCGCSVSSSMFGNHDIMYVFTCPGHRYLESEDKTLKQLADDIQHMPLVNFPMETS